MAAYARSSSALPLQYNQPTPSQPSNRKQASKQRFVAELSQCLFDFVIQLLPTAEEMAVKEDVRKLLERLIRTIEPHSRLLSFGSTGNGFALRNSGKLSKTYSFISCFLALTILRATDMDLCCLIDSDERLSATDLVTMLGDLLERGALPRIFLYLLLMRAHSNLPCGPQKPNFM
jgi:terminal uridylyltransferase